VCAIGRIPEDRHAGNTGDGLLEQLQELPAQLLTEERHPRDVPPGSCQAPDEPEADRIPAGQHHDRNRGGRLLRCANGGGSDRHDGVDLEANQLGRERGETVRGVGPSGLYGEILTLYIAEFAERPPKRLLAPERPGRNVAQPADPPRLPRRLRLSSDRRGKEGEDEQGDGQPRHGTSRWPGCYAVGRAGSTPAAVVTTSPQRDRG
jgi:hypothetical protein